MSTPREDVKARIDAIEESYEFFLAYAAQGLSSDREAKSGHQLREFLGQLEKALDGLGDAFRALAAAETLTGPADAWNGLIGVLDADASASLVAIRVIMAREGISSQLIDNLNANIHLRALLTDLFLVDDLID